ncbi:MAG TPA: hypothetical protein DIU15_06445, partial [Deltaproteobacteria bacterium]|nr:hypothetical protein [Deltaproteobacteria bacterium]
SVTDDDDSSGQADNVRFVASKNTWSTSYIGAIGDAFDVDHPAYLFLRNAQFALVQKSGMFAGDSRPTQWVELSADNPLLFGAFHQTSWMDWAAYRSKDNDADRLPYEYASSHDFHDTLLHHDTDNVDSEINGVEKAASAFGGPGASLRVTDPGLASYMAQLAHDVLTGGNLTGDAPRSGPDVSSFMGWFNDNTSLRQPRPNNQLKRPWAPDGQGTVQTLISEVTTQARVVRINGQPGAGVVGEDVFFFETDRIGYIGYGISDYDEVNGGRSELTLAALPNAAHSVQTVRVTAGMRYCITDSSNATSSADWDANGTPSAVAASEPQWTPAWLDYQSNIASLVEASTGNAPGIGWNGITDSLAIKESQGWAHPHGFYESAQYPTAENFFKSRADYVPSTSHGYSISTVDMEQTMRGIYFASSFYDPNTTGFMATRAHGVTVETGVWGTDWDDLNDLDATLLRFHLFLLSTVPDVIHGALLLSTATGRRPVLTEEAYLDFDTNWSGYTALGTYDPIGGGSGTTGPKHSFQFKAPDWGERGYFVRLGDFLAVGNCADFPDDYGSVYNPSNLSGGYTPRAGLDEIQPADWETLYTEGVLDPSETLQRLDFGSYYNPVVTDWLRANSNGHWTEAHYYGPEQPHPNDGDGAYTWADHPWVARSASVNTGADLDMTQTLPLGPQEAIFFQIIDPK